LRQIGGDHGAIEREQAQAHAGEDPLPGSAATVHGADISSAGTPVISFTAMMAARRHREKQSNEVIDPFRSDLPIAAVNNQIGSRHDLFPSVIANRSQLEERTPQMPLNGIV
jgi:hypothetical protein